MHRFLAARLLATALGLSAALAAAAAGPAEVAVTFDPDLARPADAAAFEAALRELVRDARARVVAGLGMEPGPEISIQVHSRAGFERRFGAEGAAIDRARFEGNRIHVNGSARLDDAVAGTVVHELVHAALDAGGTGQRLPRWLDEGLAERLSWQRRGMERPSPSQLALLKQAREKNELLPLPSAGELSRLGYLESWAVVVFLDERCGRDRVLAAVRATLGGEPFDRAARRELGLSPEEIGRAFDAWVARL